jgi:cytochrome c peroxidase
MAAKPGGSQMDTTRPFGNQNLVTTMLGLLLAGSLSNVLHGEETPSASLPKDTLPTKLELDTLPLGLTTRGTIPADNQLTTERVALGRRLFFDGLLSADKTVSCASCHLPEHGFAQPDAVATGVGGVKGTRNSPTIFNRVFGTSFFWDGRAATLEEQALQPIENPLEMATKVSTVLERLRLDATYVAQFNAAYGDGVSADNLAKALASFERVLLSGNSPADRFHAGEFSSLTDQERQGLWLFESRGQCWKCHSGSNFSDEGFHNTGVSWGKAPIDLGRFDVTDKAEDRGQFHTPSLRNVAITAPYMHDGSMKSLEEVVEFYDRGGQANPNLDALIKPLNLSESEKASLVAYLKALTGSDDKPSYDDEDEQEQGADEK